MSGIALWAALLTATPAEALALGHPSWRVRDGSQRLLEAQGAASLPALCWAAFLPDPEARFRARWAIRRVAPCALCAGPCERCDGGLWCGTHPQGYDDAIGRYVRSCFLCGGTRMPSPLRWLMEPR